MPQVLIAEAVQAPQIGPGCTLTGGLWWSYYDEREVDRGTTSGRIAAALGHHGIRG
ncbi:hypothetical protein [Streptomyces lavendulae]|uniref:hypothetical protein n=1 Tax=Streptomyces lavendulae TaxID=1914 RepID=UPI0036E7CAAA